MYKLFVDDIRDYTQYYNGEFVVARSYHEAIDIINERGFPAFISFDHDLADFKAGIEKTGYDLAKYIVNAHMDNPTNVFPEWSIHSANPVGAENIRSYIEGYLKICGK